MPGWTMNMQGQYVPENNKFYNSERPGIYIRSRDVKYAGVFGAQHLFILFVLSDGSKYVIRGGPKNDQMLFDDLYISKDKYTKAHVDYTENCFSQSISESFTDAQIQHYMDTMSLLAAYINAQMYDYKLPFGDNVQNSNTVVKFLIERSGLPFALPKDKNGNEIWAPGVDGKFGHTQLDSIIRSLLSIPDSVIRDHVLLSAALGLEALFDRTQRERTASAQNAESFANNFGRGTPPSAAPTAGPPTPSTPPTTSPTKGPSSGSGPMPTSTGPSSSNQAPFTKASSSPTRTYTHPSTTPINTPNFAPAFSSRAPINTPNFAPTFRSGNANPFSSHRPAPTFNPFPVPNFSPFAEFKRSREPSTSRPSSPFPPINRPTSSSSYRQQQPSFNSQSNTPTYYPSYGSYYGSYNRMNDPTWLYTRTSARDFGAYRSFYNARNNLGSNYNRENFYRTAGGMGSDWYNYYGTGQQNARSRMGSARSASWTQNMQGSIRYAASHVSPLVLDLNCNNEIELLSYKDGVYFDIDNDGFAEKIGWTKPEDGQLARDVNHNGKIDDISELFGDDITTAYYKLSTLDANKDKVIDNEDPAYKELLIWQDKNLNGYSERDELKSLEQAGIKSISLKTALVEEEIEGNLILEKSYFLYSNGTKCMVADVHYHNDDMNSWYKGRKSAAISAADTRLRAELDKFSKEVYTAIYARLDEVTDGSFKQDAAIIAQIIEQQLGNYLEISKKSIKESEERIEQELQDAEANLRDIAKLSDARFLEIITKFVQNIEESRSQEKRMQQDEAFALLKLEYQQQKDNIKSKYIQKLNEQLEDLAKQELPAEGFTKEKVKIEKALAKEEKIELAHAQDNYTTKYSYIKDSLNYKEEQGNSKLHYLREQFEQDKIAIIDGYKLELEQRGKELEQKLNLKFEEDLRKLKNNLNYKVVDKQTYKKELKKLKEKLQLNIAKERKKLEGSLLQKQDKDIEEVRQIFRKKYIIEQKILDEIVVKALQEKVAEEGYLTKQLAHESIKALGRFYSARYYEQKQDLKLYKEALTGALSEEAHLLFEYIKYVTDEFIKSEHEYFAASPTTWLYGFYSYFLKDSYVQERLSEWLQGKLTTSTPCDKQDEEEIIEIDHETLFMPLMRGYGQIPSLHIAMSSDKVLKAMVMDFMFLKTIDLNQIQEKITNILYTWAGVQETKNNKQTIRISANIEAPKLAFIEKLTGQAFKQLGAANFVGQHASTAMQKAWDLSLIRSTENLLVQGPLTPIFPKAAYSFDADNIDLKASLDEILANAAKFAQAHSLKYDFWVQIGYILAMHSQDLEASITTIREKLSKAAGERVNVGLDPFSLVGTNNNDEIKGSAGSDYIKGLEGSDKILSKDGSDFIAAGEGDDEVFAGSGIDRIYGGAGNDILHGEQDRDFIYGEAGDDKIFGGEGDDDIEGGEGADYLDGGLGRNKLSYGMSQGGVKVNLATKEAAGFDAAGDVFINFTDLGGSEHDDILTGDDQDNDINGEGGNDIICGGKGNDYLFGAQGRDTLLGEEGDDILVGFTGPDHMDGGVGKDTVSYHHPYSLVGVRVNLKEGKGFGGYAHGDTYINIENVEGSKFDDVITGDHHDNELEGMEGNDVIHGADGNDKIIDPYGSNELYGDDGDDYIISGISNTCYGGNGTDVISYEMLSFGVKIDMEKGETSSIIYNSQDKFFEFENVIGSNFNDTIIGDANDNKLFGLGGDDIIFAGAGDDYVVPGEGKDKVYGGKGNDHIMGSDGADIYDGGEGIDIVDYSNEPNYPLVVDFAYKIMKGASFALHDKLINIEGIIGTKFNDTLLGDEGNNRLFGFDGDDVIKGREGNDILSGGKGRNELYGEDGNDMFFVGLGENKIYGGAGTNTISYKDATAGVEINFAQHVTIKNQMVQDVFEDIHYAEGSNFNDKIIGNSQMNKLSGLAGDDYIDGAGGDDTIDGGKGNNTLIGGHGNDKFILDMESFNKVDGGNGTNTIDYSEFMKEEYAIIYVYEYQLKELKKTKLNGRNLIDYPGFMLKKPYIPERTGIRIDLNNGTTMKPGNYYDTFSDIGSIIGTHYNDYIVGDDKDNELNGNDGNDNIYGGMGDDVIIAGRGHSHLFGEDGNDKIAIHYGTADIDGGLGNDSVELFQHLSGVKINLEEQYIVFHSDLKFAFKSIESIKTTNFKDIVYDSNGSDYIETQNGDDTIYIRNGNDYVHSGNGDDLIYLDGAGEKIIFSGSGADKYIITENFQAFSNASLIFADFNPVLDTIDLTNLHVRGLQDMKLSNGLMTDVYNASYNCVMLEIIENTTIMFFNVNFNELATANFIFA